MTNSVLILYFDVKSSEVSHFRSAAMFSTVVCILLFSCSTSITSTGHQDNKNQGTVSLSSPPCLVYKTRADYTKNVPVLLSADRSFVISYPDVKDVQLNGSFSYPTVLTNGYLLDNRGIGPNVAFLTLTYEQFASLRATPTSEELMLLVLDKDPLLELFRCGNRDQFSDISKELITLISEGKINSCVRLK